MKQKILVLTAVLLSALFLLTGCRTNTNTGEEEVVIPSYSDYKNIPDFGAMTGIEPNEELAKEAAARLNVEEDTVRVYPLTEDAKEQVFTWKEEVKARNFSPSGDLEEDGNTVRYYSEDRKIGLIAGFMDTDGKDGADALGVLLVGKADRTKYVDMDFEEIQNKWSNANNGGTFFIDEKKIYGYGYIGSAEEGFLSKNTDSSNPVMILEGAQPKYVLEYDRYVYAALPERLISYDTKEKDAEEAVATVLEEELTSLQIYNDKLYYTTKNGLFAAEMDGTAPQKLSGKEMLDVYIVADKVFYRSPADDNKEHAYSLLTKADTRITEEAVSGFFLGSKGYGYYIAERDIEPEASEEVAEESSEETPDTKETAKAEEANGNEEEADDGEEAPTTAFKLIKIALKDGETTELATVREGSGIAGIDGKVYFISDEHEGQIYSVAKNNGTPKRVTRDKDCGNLMTFHDMILYYDYSDEEEDALEHIYISTTDGFMKSDILR